MIIHDAAKTAVCAEMIDPLDQKILVVISDVGQAAGAQNKGKQNHARREEKRAVFAQQPLDAQQDQTQNGKRTQQYIDEQIHFFLTPGCKKSG